MKILGQGQVHFYERIDECPHTPGNEELWQESFALFTWDVKQQVFVFLRLSQEPNRGKGYTTAWVNVWTQEKIFKHTDDSIPFATGDRTDNSLNAGNGRCGYAYDGKHNWAVNDGDVQLRISMEDHHPGFGFWPAGDNNLAKETGKNHIEATGEVSGEVIVCGKRYDFSGIGWRDHSWGKRNWRGIRAHRYYAGILDDGFRFFGITMVGADGGMVRIGTIIRGDTVQATTDFDIVAFIGEDGISNYGGKVLLKLDGQVEELHFEPFAKSVVSLHQDCVISDGMCKVTMGGRTGVGISESSNNAHGGLNRPNVFPHSKGILENGTFANVPTGVLA
ncbi:MAG: hypothetical protein ABW049_11425 [Spongiibacteraceae bacterium]